MAKRGRREPPRNPRPVEIYRNVVAVVAQKGSGRNAGKVFEHRYTSKPRMYGLPDGSVLITHRRLR